jgi:hypothetical protein
MKYCLCLIFLPLCLSGQSLQPVLRNIDHISISPQGNVFAATEKGDVLMLDSLGKVMLNFSPRRPARIHLLEAWNGLRIFAFNRDYQNYFLLDRFLLSDGPVALDREKGYARLLAPSQDGNLWQLDEAAFELRKIETGSGRILFSTPLDLILSGRNYQFSFMREFQNQLYLADLTGPLLVFDLNGTFRKKLPIENCSWFGFEGEDLFCLRKGEIISYQPFLLKERRRPLPPGLEESGEMVRLKNHEFYLQKGSLFRLGRKSGE